MTCTIWVVPAEPRDSPPPDRLFASTARSEAENWAVGYELQYQLPCRLVFHGVHYYVLAHSTKPGVETH